MHKQWQKELQNVKLSDRQKLKLKAAMQSQASHKKPLAPRIIFPAFILLTLLLIFWNPSASNFSSASNAIAFESITPRIIIWLIVTQSLLVVSYIFIILCIRQVKRWDNRPTIQTLRTRLNTSKGNVIGTFLLLTIMAFMWSITLILPHTLVAEAFFTISFIVCFMSILTYLTRHAKKGTCPHCETKFSYTQLLKFGFKTMPMCPSCRENMSPKTYRGADSASYVWVPMLMLMQYTTLYYWYVVALFIVCATFIIVYILPYRTEYIPMQKNDLPPPLW